MDPAREELIGLLGELSGIRPSMRFGQLVANMALLAKGPAAGAIWDVTDEELIVATKNHIQRHKDTGIW